jgi:hypothetical protein
MEGLRVARSLFAFTAIIFLTVAVRPCVVAAQVNVTTWHNDNWRTGQNTKENILTETNVNHSQFGLICKISVSGELYGQPLVVANAGGGMMVYVATMQDYVYAFNVPASLTSANCPTPTVVNLLQNYPDEHPADCCYVGPGAGKSGCNPAFDPTAGVLSTPVIDTAAQALYLVAESQVGPSSGYNPGACTKGKPPSTWIHRLHALDLSSANFLNEKFNGPVVIPSATVGIQQFSSQKLIQRPGLLLLPGSDNPTVYIAFSMMDGTRPKPSGWIFGYNAKNLTSAGYPLTYATTPGVVPSGGGIWQGGAGLAAGVDATQNTFIYFSTADGVFDLDSAGQDAGDSFVKLAPDLTTTAGYFTPSDELYRWCNQDDLDFGSGGVMLVPDKAITGFPYVAIHADKENYLWAMDRTNPGGFNPGTCSNYCSACNASCQACPASGWSNQNDEAFQFNSSIIDQTRSTPAYWNQHIFQAQPFGPLNKYRLNCTNPGPICTTSIVNTSKAMGYAATPSISSSGTSEGIVWVLRLNSPTTGRSTPGPLAAFSAETMAELYDNDQCPTRDLIGAPTRFSVPTIANGYVFVGTQSDFDIFGLTGATCE